MGCFKRMEDSSFEKMKSKSLKYRNFVSEISSWLLIFLFMYTAVSKLIDWDGTKSALYNQVFPLWMADILLFLIPTIELFLVICLYSPSIRRYGFLFSIFVMASFTAYVGLVLTGIFGRIPCSCGGVISELSWMEHLIFNLVFLGIALLGYWSVLKINY